MSQALHTSSTGINAGQAQINVIANNVANINTVAYKSANVTFQTLFSNNLSYGSAATKDGGGTNPKQIGLGVKIGGITRNFTPGTFVQTGRDMDCMISGTGFFVVQDADGKQYFTRDGVFSVDSAGNLVTTSGMKVVGAESIYSNSGSSTTVKVPKNIKATVTGDTDLGTKKLTELNNASIKSGTVAVSVRDKTTGAESVFSTTIDANQTVAAVVAALNGATNANGDSLESTGMSFSVNGDGTLGLNLGNNTFEVDDTTTSNFFAATNLSNNNTTSKELSQVVTLKDMVYYNDPDAASLKSTAIDENGIIVATYTDGSILTQYVDEAEAVQWKFTTPEGVVITADDVTASGSIVSDTNFVIELATMVNQEGLLSYNSNLWQWGPDVGEIYYGMAGEMAFGGIESGGYEESNVDIAAELSNMISAQRMIQMNSRVFSTASSVMETLAYLGQ